MASKASTFETGFSVISMFKIVGFFVEDRRDDLLLTTDPPFVGNALMSRSTDDIFVTFRSGVVLSIVLFVFFVVDNDFPSCISLHSSKSQLPETMVSRLVPVEDSMTPVCSLVDEFCKMLFNWMLKK